ncbi:MULTISPECIES: PepSY domain-containing protein [Streptomyces]|uniref:PepSY domain-containing protein n=1 Tax=Streptomyces TaxID=1883 RepID=UPI0009822ABF|nr:MULTISPECIES: PepSY domain-containing protein [Streptomyces]ARH93239.1 peptidase M4 [Streptomyces sp. MOE7]
MKRHLVIATAAAAALVAGGTVTAVAVSGGGAPSGPSDAPSRQAAGPGRPGTEDAREAAAAKVTAPQAAAAALKAVPGTVTGLDLDRDRPGLVWDADVLGKDGKWHELTLDAGDARVLNQHVEQGDDDDHTREQAALKTARTDAAGAARTAAAAHGTVTSVELDGDHRARAVWEVETVGKDGKEHKLLVDPDSGKLTTAPAHDADDDDNDGADD